jgi:hypothetical protein
MRAWVLAVISVVVLTVFVEVLLRALSPHVD